MAGQVLNIPLENDFQKLGFFIGVSYFVAILLSVIFYAPQKVVMPASFDSQLNSSQDVAPAGALFRDFDRTEFREGKAKFNIKALQAEYLSGGGFIKLLEPDVKIFGVGKERPTFIKANNSRLTLKEEHVENAFLEGNVEIISSSGAIIHTATAEYVEKEARLNAPQHVYIDGPGYHIEGDSSIVNTLTDEVLISGNVSSKFESAVQMPVIVKKSK